MAKPRITDGAIREHCKALGYSFKPWEPVPWEVHSPTPPAWESNQLNVRAWGRIWQLRQKLIADLSSEESG